MRLVTLLLLIQLGYSIAKAVETPNSCNDSPEIDPRIKRSDEIDIDSEITEKTIKGPEDSATREKFPEQNNENDNDLRKSDNDNEETHEFTSNPNTLPQKLTLVSNVTKLPANIEKGGNVTSKLTTEGTPIEETVYYKAIDPKYLIISGLKPKPNKNVTNIIKNGESVPSLEESKTSLLEDVNTTEVMNVSNKGESNEIVGKEKDIAIDDRYTDVTNIRELREHLLDHLLDYFINIIKEENLIRNNTRKNNGKDRMKVEEKLRNYYDPHHLDMVIVNDDHYDDNNLDYHGNYREEDLLDNIEELNRGNVTNIHAFNTLADENAGEIHKSSKDLQELPLNLEEHLKSSSPDGESFNVTLPGPVTPENINLIKEENDLRITFINATEKSEDVYNSNVNLTTTERSSSNESLNDGPAEIDMKPLNYLEEVVTDKIGNVYDNGAVILDAYTSYEDYIDSDEFQVTKNGHKSEINPIVDTNENGRRKNGLNKEVSIEHTTLGGIKNVTNAQILTNSTTNTSSKHDKDVKIKNFVNLDHTYKNIDDDAPCNEKNLSENKNKNSSKNSKHGGNKVKLTRNNNCRKSIVLNLKINII